MPSDQVPRDGAHILKALLEIVGASWVTPRQFDQLAESIGMAEVLPKIIFYQGLKDIFRAMPDKVYPSENHRELVMGALQEALDIAIEAEEELVAQDEISAGEEE